MKYRQSNILPAKSILTAGTETIDLSILDPISRITIRTSLTNNSWTPTGHPARSIIKVELVDGANVLHSLRGTYSEAMAFYGTGKQPYNYANYTDNGVAIATVPIYFGRWLWDKVFALDPKKFRNLQLKISHNYALGGASPDAASMEVWADIFDEMPPSPLGYMRSTSLWSRTLVASTTDYVEIPTDYPIRLLCPAAFSNAEEPDINIDNIKVTEDGDKRTLFEMSILNAIYQYETQYPEWNEYCDGRALAATDKTFYVAPQKDIRFHPVTTVDLDSVLNTIWGGGGVRVVNGSITATIEVDVHGRCPFGVVPLKMGTLEDPESWWDVRKVGQPRIKIVTGAGSTAAELELLLQQVVNY